MAATVRIQGVPFELDDAADFARRLERASIGESLAGLTPAQALAIEVGKAANDGSGDVAIRDEARPIACAVLNDWLRTAPDSAKHLRLLLCGPDG